MERINHKTFKDDRGSYTPISTTVLDTKWEQCSISINDKQFTFRGLHYQTNPPQTKYIKVVQGSIVDFMVDLETGETDYIALYDSDAVLIPNNKAHGFLTLEPNTIVVYMVEGEYNPESEHSIVWDTNKEVKRVVNNFKQQNPLIISEKDALGK
jgi:dTDP-4-dehydrorhamnose 3,5-epimerase